MTDTDLVDVRPGGGSAISESPAASDDSVRAQGRANVAIAKIVDKLGRGSAAIILVAAFASLAIAAWSAGRVQSLGDYVHADHDAYQRDALAMNIEYQHELSHYVEEFNKMERQFRMTELKLDDWTVVAHRSGLALPGDYTRGPQGNLDAESFHIPQRKPKGPK